MKTRFTSSGSPGFTLVEMLIASAVALTLLACIYGLFSIANVLATKSFAINSTGTDSHNTLDKLQGAIQTAYTTPIPIDTTGAALSGTLNITGATAISSGLAPIVSGSTAIITGTGPGIKFYRYVGGPYIPTIPTGGLAGNATSVTVELDKSAQVVPTPPQANDILVINTTAIQGASGFQAWATVSGSSTLASTSGNRVKYLVPLLSPMKDSNGTTITSIAYQTDNLGTGVVSYSAVLLRPTAFIIVTNGTNRELRMFDGYATDSSGKVILTGTNYTTLTRAINTGTSNLSQFGVATFGGRNFVGLTLRVRSTDYDNYLLNKQNDGFCTYMGFSSFHALKSKP